MNRLLPALLCLVLAVGGTLAATNDAPTPTGVIVVPERVDLGPRLAATVADDLVWLVNTADHPIRVESVKGNCGCITTKFEPATLDPNEALAVQYSIKVPKEVGTEKTKKMTFAIEGQDPLVLPIHVVASDSEKVLESCEPDRGLNAAPARLDLGDVVAGERHEGEVWLINTSNAPLEVLTAKTGCGCMKLVDFTGVELAPSHAARVTITMSAPKHAGHERTRCVYFRTAAGDRLPVPVSIRSE
jgi:hypothetical protein